MDTALPLSARKQTRLVWRALLTMALPTVLAGATMVGPVLGSHSAPEGCESAPIGGDVASQSPACADLPDADGDGVPDIHDDVVDVPNNTFAYRYVQALINADVTSGCGGTAQHLRFCPNAAVTRGDMSIFLARAGLGRPAANALPSYTSGFSDVSAGDYFSRYVRYLVDNQITSGCGGGKYCPLNPVIRGDMSIFLARTSLGRAAADELPAYAAEFTDVTGADYFAKSVKWAKDEGITAGCGTGVFCPTANVTRGQMAIFLVRAFGLPLPA